MKVRFVVKKRGEEKIKKLNIYNITRDFIIIGFYQWEKEIVVVALKLLLWAYVKTNDHIIIIQKRSMFLEVTMTWVPDILTLSFIVEHGWEWRKPVGVKGLKFCKTVNLGLYIWKPIIYIYIYDKPWTRMGFSKSMYKVRDDVLENNPRKTHT